MYNHNPTFLTSFLCVTEAKAKNKRKKKKKKKQHNKFFTVLGDPVTVTILNAHWNTAKKILYNSKNTTRKIVLLFYQRNVCTCMYSCVLCTFDSRVTVPPGYYVLLVVFNCCGPTVLEKPTFLQLYFLFFLETTMTVHLINTKSNKQHDDGVPNN